MCLSPTLMTVIRGRLIVKLKELPVIRGRRRRRQRRRRQRRRRHSRPLAATPRSNLLQLPQGTR